MRICNGMPTRSLMQAPFLPVKSWSNALWKQVLGAGAVVGNFFVMGGVPRSTGAVQQILETRSAVRIETSNAQCSQTNMSNTKKHALLLFSSFHFISLSLSCPCHPFFWRILERCCYMTHVFQRLAERNTSFSFSFLLKMITRPKIT